MFVRVRERQLKNKRSRYAYLVDNRWNTIRKKHEQTIVACLGDVETLPVDGTIEKIICALDTFAAKQGFASLSRGIVLSDITDEGVLSGAYDYGTLLVARHVLVQTSITSSIEHLSTRYTANLALPSLLSATGAMIAHRLTNRSDASERATHAWYTDHLFVPGKTPVTPMDFYRSLDFLVDHKDAIEQAYFDNNRDLFSQRLDLVLFDTTSVYYWGKQNTASDAADLLQY